MNLGLGVASVSSALRGLSWLVGPVAPSTRVGSDAAGITVTTRPGVDVDVTFVLTNRQAASCPVRPAVGVLVGAEGTRWRPRVTGDDLGMLRAGERRTFTLRLAVPQDLPIGPHRGAVVLAGMSDGDVPLLVEVTST